MNKMSPDDIIKPLCWLIGKWTSTCASGKYPTMKPFQYTEELEFAKFGQPILQYTSKTYMGEKKRAMHFESGFLRIKPATKTVSLLVSHNFGITSIEEGEITCNTMNLRSKQIGRMCFASEPFVCSLERKYLLCGDSLNLVVLMATSKTPLCEHLRVSYKKAC